MGHPSDRIFTVPEGATHSYYNHSKAKCVVATAGDEVRMSAEAFAACMGVSEKAKDLVKKGHPKFEGMKGGVPAFPSNTYTIEPGEHICIVLADLGDCPPELLNLNWCSGCLRTSVDTLLPPETLTATENLNGAAINEQFPFVGEDPVTCVRPEKFYIYNTNSAPQTVSVTPHS